MRWMHFNRSTTNVTRIKEARPPYQRIRKLIRPLRHASCAVVGASSALEGCSDAKRICSHDFVMHVNDHVALLKLCPRVDFQFVNGFACYWQKESHWFKKWFTEGAHTTLDGGAGRNRGCSVQPRLARIRHEWNAAQLDRYSRGALLASGLATRAAHDSVGGCCASAGGVAVAFALRACKSVTAYGLGGVNRSHIDNRMHRIVAVHNLTLELAWFRSLVRDDQLTMRCSG